MKKISIATALLVLSLTTLGGLTGCHSDPQDTHIATDVTSPR